jgi:probable O-glycosylation ligase (exosortase A-associated)
MFFLFAGGGLAIPFVATLGYVWLDIFQPQNMYYVLFLSSIPVAMIMALAAFGTYFGMDRRSPPPVTPEMALQIMMAIWVTFTSLTVAVAPGLVWSKWDWAFKTILFTTFIPFSIRSRAQIEAFVQVFLFSLAANGYGTNLGLQDGNSGLAEGGLLSTTCLMAIPLALHLAGHTRLLPTSKLWRFMYWGMAGLALATAVGTYERSALIGMGVLGIALVARSKNKAFLAVVVLCVATVIAVSAGTAYMNRMSTITTYQQDTGSAEARLRVWNWTMNFALTHPLGGGFMAFSTSVIEVPGTSTEPAHVETGRAYHSSYFEVLGEQGFPGIAIFFGMALLTFRRLGVMRRMTRDVPEFEWLASLCSSIEIGMLVFFTSSAFVSLSFQPMIWYFVALTLAINGHLYHARRMAQSAPGGWLTAGRMAVSESPLLNGWRNRGTVLPSRSGR